MIRYLGSGANDLTYLIRDGRGNFLVAYLPIDGILDYTRYKFRKVAQLEALGLGQYLVHQVTEGLLPLIPEDGSQIARIPTPRPVLIAEYGGVPVMTAEGEGKRLDLLRQVWHVIKTLHNNRYEVRDFKFDHWLYLEDETGALQVKLIDYTQISQVKEDTPTIKHGDARPSDLRYYLQLTNELFPWFAASLDTSKALTEQHTQVEQLLLKISQQSADFSPPRKQVLTVKNKIRSQFYRWLR